MKLTHWHGVGFEQVLPEGRTHPLVISCHLEGDEASRASKVIKAIGCPEIMREWLLVCEVVGNAVAREMGILTPEPCIVYLSEEVTKSLNPKS